MAEDQSQKSAVASPFIPKACQTNRKLCFLCQLEKNEKLVCPVDGKTSSPTGYETIATNIVKTLGLCSGYELAGERIDPSACSRGHRGQFAYRETVVDEV